MPDVTGIIPAAKEWNLSQYEKRKDPSMAIISATTVINGIRKSVFLFALMYMDNTDLFGENFLFHFLKNNMADCYMSFLYSLRIVRWDYYRNINKQF